MRKVLYSIIAVLMLAVVFIDHYTVNKELDKVEMVQTYQIQDVILAEKGLQETLLLTSRRLDKSESEVVEGIQYIRQLRETNALQESVLLSSAATIKELIDDNARIQGELDAALVQLELKSQALDTAKKELKNRDD